MTERRVLVVEDVPELSHLLGMTIELDDRFTPAASARSGPEALEMAQVHRPDAIVLDVSIDGAESGMDVLPELRKLLPEARIIVFTAHGNLQQQEKALARGASDYIVKGGDLQPLLDSLAR
ncbi:MAG: response regulator [Frankiaceae bacterium]|nr:response regulator [Frankiaceae bacterium]